MNKVYLALGSNLGNRKANIVRATYMISKRMIVLKISKLYETKPVGYANQPDFINAVIKVETLLTPQQVLSVAKSIEDELKRIKTIKDGPRTIDIDVLFYNDKVINEEGLIIPHPRIQQRSFVLEPMIDVSPDYVHPVLGKNMTMLYEELRSL